MFARFFRVMFFITYGQIIGNAFLVTDARLLRFCRSVRQFSSSLKVEKRVLVTICVCRGLVRVWLRLDAPTHPSTAIL